MAIRAEARSWNPGDEGGWTRAIRSLTLEASTEAEAGFLSELLGCFRRGKVDANAFGKLANRVLDPD